MLKEGTLLNIHNLLLINIRAFIRFMLINIYHSDMNIVKKLHSRIYVIKYSVRISEICIFASFSKLNV